MATGGDETVLDSRVTCSVCLEPYRGRQPKLLPCSHTFCLPCLKQLAQREKAASLSKIVIEDDDDAQTITCPTCRTPVHVPAGGVERLHNNIYVDGGETFAAARPLNCDLCEEGQEAKLTCSGCRACFCTCCHRVHNKLCKTGKVTEIKVQEEKVSERAMPKDTKEALEMLQAVFLKLSGGEKGAASFANSSGELNALNRLSDSTRGGQGDEEMDNKALTSAVNQLTKTVAELKSQNSVLFRDFNAVHEKNAQLERQSKKDRDAVACLERELISLRDKIAILCQDNQQLHNDISKVQGDVSKVQADVSKVQADVSKVQDNVSKVQADVIKVKADVSKVQGDVSKVQGNVSKVQGNVSKVQGNVSKVQADVSKVKGDVSKIQDDVSNVQASVTKIEDGGGALKPQDDAVLKKEVADLKKVSAQTEQDVKLFKDRLGKQVHFNAIKSANSHLRKSQTVICDSVISNVGDGYNSKTGVFTANVSGTYCFFVLSGPACNRGEEGVCVLEIVVNDNVISCLSAFDRSTCTAHTVVNINAGDRVWLRASRDGLIGGLWSTSFTGVLVQPDFGF